MVKLLLSVLPAPPATTAPSEPSAAPTSSVGGDDSAADGPKHDGAERAKRAGGYDAFAGGALGLFGALVVVGILAKAPVRRRRLRDEAKARRARGGEPPSEMRGAIEMSSRFGYVGYERL